MVTTTITGEYSEEELRILSALHGIGVIILNSQELEKSEILLPAKRKNEIDWQSINRIAGENRDFERFISYVNNYYASDNLIAEIWNK